MTEENEPNIDEIAQRFQSFFFDSEKGKENIEKPLSESVMEEMGGIDGKEIANVSLASHIFNAVLIGLNTYIYDSVKVKDKNIQEIEWHDVRLLTAVLTLHDVNKHLGYEDNSENVVEEYFEEDKFEIEKYLGGDYFEELLWLIQRTEVHEDSFESRGTPPENRNLKRYARIGDAVASRISKEGPSKGESYLEDEYSFEEEKHVHTVHFTSLEQPLLNDILLSAAKLNIKENGGVVIGSTSEEILYLNDTEVSMTNSELSSKAEEVIAENYADNLSAKINARSFKYKSLEEVEMPFSKKVEKMGDQFREVLEGGPAGEEPHENVDENALDYIPYLARALHKDGKEEFKNPEMQEAYDEVEEEFGGSYKLKILFISKMAEDFPKHEDALKKIRKKQKPKLKKDLKPSSPTLSTAILRFTGDVTDDRESPSKESMCFICGSESTEQFSPGYRPLLRSRGFSRRISPLDDTKKICNICSLEYSLLEAECGGKDEVPHTRAGYHFEFVYLYYDDFVADVAAFESLESNLVQEDGVLDEPEFGTSALLSHQYHLQPFNVSDKNSRMKMVRRVLQLLQSTGMKARIGKPFNRFSDSKHIFYDEEPLRQQVVFGSDKIDEFENLERPLELFSIIEALGKEGDLNKPYLELDADNLYSIIHFTALNDEDGKFTAKVLNYVKEYHEDDYMQMKEIAQNGRRLFGEHKFSKKHKKTKIFRTALDAFLRAKSKGMAEEDIDEYVRGQVKETARNEKFSGEVTNEQVKEFTDSVKSYLKENDLYELKQLSDWENALTNTYLYAFDDTSGDSNGN
ncbi:MAG: hypothetical protein ABEJ95_04185 [Candidatus Nanohalobium sp.]